MSEQPPYIPPEARETTTAEIIKNETVLKQLQPGEALRLSRGGAAQDYEVEIARTDNGYTLKFIKNNPNYSAGYNTFPAQDLLSGIDDSKLPEKGLALTVGGSANGVDILIKGDNQVKDRHFELTLQQGGQIKVSSFDTAFGTSIGTEQSSARSTFNLGEPTNSAPGMDQAQIIDMRGVRQQ